MCRRRISSFRRSSIRILASRCAGATAAWLTLHYGPHGDHGKVGILLQDFYVKEFAENLQMHLLVADVDAWWAHVQDKRIAETYAVHTGPPENRPWKMRDFVLVDPSGVLWRIAQDAH